MSYVKIDKKVLKELFNTGKLTTNDAKFSNAKLNLAIVVNDGKVESIINDDQGEN